MPQLVQYIIVRGDLGWPMGALIAQACHASVAALAKYKDLDATKEYLSDLQNMHKVVLKCSNKQITDLSTTFLKENVDYYLWTEMPENIISSLATRPYEKNFIRPFVKHLKLFD